MADPKFLRVARGFDGWSPRLAIVADGNREVIEVVGWSGGTGNPPVSGVYLGSIGYVTNIADAVNIRGSSSWSLNNQTGTSYNVTSDDVTESGLVLLTCTNASAITVNIDSPAELGVPTGKSWGLTICQGGAGIITITATGDAVLVGQAVFTTQNEAKTLIAISDTTWRLLGAQ